MQRKLSRKIKKLIVMEVAGLALSAVFIIALIRAGIFRRVPQPLHPLIISLVVAVVMVAALALTSLIIKLTGGGS